MAEDGMGGPLVLIHRTAKIACNTCASGKRRCNGAMPTCGRCTALHKACFWPPAAVETAGGGSGGTSAVRLGGVKEATTLGDAPSSGPGTMTTLFVVLPPVLLPWHRLSLAPLSEVGLPRRPRSGGGAVQRGEDGEEEEDVDVVGRVEGGGGGGGGGGRLVTPPSQDDTASAPPLPSHDPSVKALHAAMRLLWALAGGLHAPRAWLAGLLREGEERRSSGVRGEEEGKPSPPHASPSPPDSTTEWAVLSSPAWDAAQAGSVLAVVLASPRPAWLIVYASASQEGTQGGGATTLRRASVHAQAISHLICNAAALESFGWTATEVLHRARCAAPLRWLLPTHKCLARVCLSEVQGRLSGERLLTHAFVGDGGGEAAAPQSPHGPAATVDGLHTAVDGYLLTRSLAVSGCGVVSERGDIAKTVDAALLPALEVRRGGGRGGQASAEDAAAALAAVLESLDDAAVYTPCTGVQRVVCWYADRGGSGGSTGGGHAPSPTTTTTTARSVPDKPLPPLPSFLVPDADERVSAGGKRRRGGRAVARREEEDDEGGGARSDPTRQDKRRRQEAEVSGGESEEEDSAASEDGGASGDHPRSAPTLRMQAVFFQDVTPVGVPHASMSVDRRGGGGASTTPGLPLPAPPQSTFLTEVDVQYAEEGRGRGEGRANWDSPPADPTLDPDDAQHEREDEKADEARALFNTALMAAQRAVRLGIKIGGGGHCPERRLVGKRRSHGVHWDGGRRGDGRERGQGGAEPEEGEEESTMHGRRQHGGMDEEEDGEDEEAGQRDTDDLHHAATEFFAAHNSRDRRRQESLDEAAELMALLDQAGPGTGKRSRAALAGWAKRKAALAGAGGEGGAALTGHAGLPASRARRAEGDVTSSGSGEEWSSGGLTTLPPDLGWPPRARDARHPPAAHPSLHPPPVLDVRHPAWPDMQAVRPHPGPAHTLAPTLTDMARGAWLPPSSSLSPTTGVLPTGVSGMGVGAGTEAPLGIVSPYAAGHTQQRMETGSAAASSHPPILAGGRTTSREGGFAVRRASPPQLAPPRPPPTPAAQ